MATTVKFLVKVALLTCLALAGLSVASAARRRTSAVVADPAPASVSSSTLPSWDSDDDTSFVRVAITPTAVLRRDPASKTTKPRPVKEQKPRPSDGQKPASSTNSSTPLGSKSGTKGSLRPLGFLSQHTKTLTTTKTAFYANPTLTPVANTHVTHTHTIRSTLTSHMIVPTISTKTNVVVTISYSTIVLPVFSTTTIVVPRTLCI